MHCSLAALTVFFFLLTNQLRVFWFFFNWYDKVGLFFFFSNIYVFFFQYIFFPLTVIRCIFSSSNHLPGFFYHKGYYLIYIYIYIYIWFECGLSIIRKSNLTDKMKCSFFQAAVVSILLHGCTTWTLTKRLEKKLDGNYTRMLRAILNKSWRQHPTRHQLYGHLPPITKTIQVRRTRHAGHCWRSRDELIRDVLLWTLTSKSRTTSSGIHSAAMWGYGM